VAPTRFPKDRASVPQTSDATRRDGLGRACFFLHIAILVYVVTGWALRPALSLYLVFLPAMVLHWHLNRGTCVLNSLESLIRNGRWRDAGNREEGAWLKTLIGDVTGLRLSVRQTDLLSYAALAGLWGLGLWRWW
jgi:hypothetical protein